MRTIFYHFITAFLASFPAFAQEKILWDGESADPASCSKAYGTIVSGADAHQGNNCFRAEPGPFHAPRIGFNCSNAWRSDISGFDELQFYIKASVPGQSTSLRFTSYYAQSEWVAIDKYIPGGTIQTGYQLVKIPLSAFKTTAYDLGSVEFLEFAKSTAGTHFFIDDIKVADTSPPVVRLKPVSGRVLSLVINEPVDVKTCYGLSNYSISSATDPDFQQAMQPAKVGRHYFVKGLKPQSGSAVVVAELYLLFDKPLKNDHKYKLQITGLQDGSGNAAAMDTSFTFDDHAIKGNVKANQVGYLPKSPKLAKLGNFLGDAGFLPIADNDPMIFQLIDNTGSVAFSSPAKHLKADADFSGEDVFELDFSAFQKPGDYHIYVPGYGRSEAFSIASDIYDEPYFHTARALFYQRTGALAAEHARQWARDGLPATTAEIHPSHSASPLFSQTDFPPGTHIPMTKGWLDAGDYGRYVPTAAGALFTLFTAFELYPEKFPDKHLGIPESGNHIPDLIDELKYETDWLAQMQAPDGGVYFRVTPATWSAGLPGEENKTLFVSEKTTQSTALFAAAMAMAARVFKPYLPDYASACHAMAEKAWTFLKAHPSASAPVNVPGISAGPYPDPEDRDNRAWAAAELYKSTGNATYHADFLAIYAQIPHQFHATMSWAHHTFKAAWAYATTKHPTDPDVVNEFKNKLLTEVLPNYNQRTMETHTYHGAYHPFKGYVGYGTFGMAQSYAFDYILFSFLLNKKELLDLAKVQLDIPLGNNPLSHSFITGLGTKAPRNPLHWSSIAGHYSDPVPGVPVFGPAASLVMNRPSSFAIQDSANRYPYGFKKEDPYPVLRRYTDAREAVEMSEFTVQEIAVTAAAFAFFSAIVADPLPVELIRFEATVKECRTTLTWETASEVNAAHFILEKSPDAKHFTKIFKIPAAGNTDQLQRYAFTDTLAGAQAFYRLRQTDSDGTFAFSKIIRAKNPCAGLDVKIRYPGKGQLEILLRSQEASGPFLGTLFRSDGLPVRHFKLTSGKPVVVNVAGLGPGIYIMKIVNEQGKIHYATRLFLGD